MKYRNLSNGKKLMGYAVFTIAVLAIVYVRHGYVFGSGDQSETMPYILWLNNHSLYPSDLFIQNLIQHPFNERRFFVEFLRFFSNHLSLNVFIIHALCSALLFCGIFVYARKKFSNFSHTWLAILVPLMIFYIFNTGSNELYDNALTPSYISNTLVIWVFVLLQQHKILAAISLLIMATFIQPLIGIQIALIVFLSALSYQLSAISFSRRLKADSSKLIAGFILYSCTAGVYVFSLLHQISASSDSKLAMQIIEMRQAHHYFPHYFNIFGALFISICATAIFILGNKREKIWSILIVAGCIVYTFGVYVLKNNFILNTQWFRITIWVKLFGTLIIAQQIFKHLEQYDFKFFFKEENFKLAINVIGLSSLILLISRISIFGGINYNFPFFKNNDPVIDISAHAKNCTPENALFLLPPDFDAFRFYSVRNNFIDYKALLHDNSFFLEWQKRMKNIYNVGVENKEKSFKLMLVAKNNFNALSDSTLSQLCAQNHVGYIIRDKAHPIHSEFNKIDSTANYAIYKLL